MITDVMQRFCVAAADMAPNCLTCEYFVMHVLDAPRSVPTVTLRLGDTRTSLSGTLRENGMKYVWWGLIVIACRDDPGLTTMTVLRASCAEGTGTAAMARNILRTKMSQWNLSCSPQANRLEKLRPLGDWIRRLDDIHSESYVTSTQHLGASGHFDHESAPSLGIHNAVVVVVVVVMGLGISETVGWCPTNHPSCKEEREAVW